MDGISEFQGGSLDAWGPTSPGILYCRIFDGVGELTLTIPGYGPCRVLTGPDFQSVFNLQLWASNAKLISYYMLYGYAVPFYLWEVQR